MGQVASACREAAVTLHRQGALPPHGQVPQDACSAHGLRPKRSCPRSKRDAFSKRHFPERPTNQVGPSCSILYPCNVFLENRKLNLLHLLYFKLQNHASFMLFSPQFRQHILLGLHLQQRQEDDQSSMRKDWSHSRAEGPEVSSTYVFFPYLVNILLETLCAPTHTTKRTDTEKEKRPFQESTKHTVQSHQSSCSANFVCPPDSHTCSCGPRERDHHRACRGRAAVRLQASSL